MAIIQANRIAFNTPRRGSELSAQGIALGKCPHNRCPGLELRSLATEGTP